MDRLFICRGITKKGKPCQTTIKGRGGSLCRRHFSQSVPVIPHIDMKDCVICLEPLEKRNNFLFECLHIIHTDCYMEFILKNPFNTTCPICRRNIDISLKTERILETFQQVNEELELDISFFQEEIAELEQSIKTLVNGNKLKDDLIKSQTKLVQELQNVNKLQFEILY